MATLQKIRSKGALLVIVIGVALLAFIAGDAWQVLQPHQAYNVGEVNGEELSGQDYQSMVEEYAEVIKMSQNLNALSDEQMNRVYDDVWNSYVNNKLIEKEAEALGLTVSTAEIQDILKTGTDPLLRQSPFQNPQTGRFDRDMLNKFLVEYAQMSETQLPAQYVEQYQKIYKYWSIFNKFFISFITILYSSSLNNIVFINSYYQNFLLSYTLLTILYQCQRKDCMNVFFHDCNFGYDDTF